MERTHALGRPALFTVTQDGQSWVGADQAWYPDAWQQKAGCGPTSAAMLVTYLAQAREEYRQIPNYDYLVVNDKVSTAAAEIISILTAEDCRTRNRLALVDGI